MTAPIGYPENFGAILRQSREPQVMASETIGKVTPAAPQGVEKSDKLLGPSFADQVKEFASGVDNMQKEGTAKAQEFAVGHSDDIHGTMIAVEQSEISLHLLANVRNRVVDLYREVMRMGS
jgi:flagellar hook-basal body complex protein FliE